MTERNDRLTSEDVRAIENTMPALKRFAHKLAGDSPEADDALQSCLEKAVTKFHLFRRGTNLRKWMFTILYNEFINQTRTAKRHSVTVPIEEWRGDVAVNGNQHSYIELRELQDELAKLPRTDRRVLYLIGVEGRSYKETGEILDVKMGTVKSRLSRARERLRARLDGRGTAVPLAS